MEIEEKILIELNELPARSEQLSIDEVSAVFGGCRAEDDICGDDCDCCGESWCPYGTCISVY